MVSDIVIIGAGVAGMTSAIYLKRAGVSPLLIESKRPGGQINFAPIIENFPSYEKITGREFANKVFEQVANLDVDYVKDDVISVSKVDEGNFIIELKSGQLVNTKSIIIATGKKIKKLDIPDANSYLGVGLSYCATCDGMFFKEKDVVVVGDTNKAAEESIYLSNICNKVFVLVEGEQMRADTFYREKLESVNNIEIIYNAKLKSLVKDEFLKSVLIENDGEEKVLNVSGCFAYVGYIPNSEMFAQLLKLNGDNYIVVDENKETSCKGIYAIGDVTNTKVYQLVTACGDAAIAVNSYLNDK